MKSKRSVNKAKGDKAAVAETKTAEPKSKTTEYGDNVFFLANLARELDKDPKTTRAKFRRLRDANDEKLPARVNDKRWAFDKKHLEAVTSLIG